MNRINKTITSAREVMGIDAHILLLGITSSDDRTRLRRCSEHYRCGTVEGYDLTSNPPSSAAQAFLA